LTTTNNKVETRLAAEGGIVKESTIGISQDGMSDPTGEYPHRNNWFNSSVSATSRGTKINNIWIGGSTVGMSFDIPYATPSIYPFNQSNTTPSGHSFEIDDTPGNERILIKHRTGAGVELKQDGSVVVASRSSQVRVVGADDELVVSGQGNMTYNGDLNLTVNGDYNVDVGGTYNLRVGANFNHSVNGSHLTEVSDIHSTLVRGNKDVRVWGDTFEFYSSELKVVAKKDVRTIVAKDFIVNSGRNNRLTAEDTFTTSSGKNAVISGKDVVVTGATGKIGGDGWHHIGSLFTGGGDGGDNGKDTTFQGNLIGRALEAWTCKYAKFSEEAHVSHYAFDALTSRTSAFATQAGSAPVSAPALTPPEPYTSLLTTKPDYVFEEADGGWGWNPRPAWNQSNDRLGEEFAGSYSTSQEWWEVFNKVSPYAVRKVIVDPDNTIESKISKLSTYTNYFNSTPTTAEIRSKLRTMHGADDTSTSPEKQTDADLCIRNLVSENRISATWSQPLPTGNYRLSRTGQKEPTAKFGYTLLGNPVERSSKRFLPTNRGGSTRVIVADPVYNPDNHNSPISSSTKLSKSTTVSKFLGCPGSRCSLDSIPMLDVRQDLARQWYLHAWLMEGISSTEEFSSYRLQVTEGYYKPASGMREAYTPGEPASRKLWREPFKSIDGGSSQRSIVSGRPTINELKNNGRAVVYTLYDSLGKVDYGATFDLSLYIRDNFFFDQLSIDYDTTRPDGIMSQQIIVVMPKVSSSFRATFEMKVCSYFNRGLYGGNDLVEILG
jgi:hypothetical protein